MFKLEFPADNKSLAAAIGKALVEYGTGTTAPAVELVAAPKECTLFGEEAAVDAYAEVLTQAAVDVLGAAEFALATSEVQTEAVDPLSLAEIQAKTAGADNVAESTARPNAASNTAGAANTVRLDEKGVPFDKEYCANAAKPFYASGKTAGQWKKGTKVEQALYDDWYALRLREAPTPAVAETTIDTTAAFSGQQTAAIEPTAVPTNAGAFMTWASEHTVAGHFTQADITAAYVTAGIDAPAIFTGDSAATANIASLHRILSAKVPA